MNTRPLVGFATAEDIPQLCGLLAILFAQEADFEPDADKQSAALYEIVAHPEAGRILVLRDGARVVAMVSLLFVVSTACGGRAALLEDMVVDPARRGDGLGGELLRAAIEFARHEGCLRVTLLTDRVNEAALRFYRRHGFNSSEMIPLRLALG